jgi:hypothetical protein
MPKLVHGGGIGQGRNAQIDHQTLLLISLFV